MSGHGFKVKYPTFALLFYLTGVPLYPQGMEMRGLGYFDIIIKQTNGVTAHEETWYQRCHWTQVCFE